MNAPAGRQPDDDDRTELWLDTADIEAWQLRVQLRVQQRELDYWRERQHYWRRVTVVWNVVWVVLSLISVAIIAWALIWTNIAM